MNYVVISLVGVGVASSSLILAGVVRARKKKRIANEERDAYWLSVFTGLFALRGTPTSVSNLSTEIFDSLLKEDFSALENYRVQLEKELKDLNDINDLRSSVSAELLLEAEKLAVDSLIYKIGDRYTASDSILKRKIESMKSNSY